MKRIGALACAIILAFALVGAPAPVRADADWSSQPYVSSLSSRSSPPDSSNSLLLGTTSEGYTVYFQLIGQLGVPSYSVVMPWNNQVRTIVASEYIGLVQGSTWNSNRGWYNNTGSWGGEVLATDDYKIFYSFFHGTLSSYNVPFVSGETGSGSGDTPFSKTEIKREFAASACS